MLSRYKKSYRKIAMGLMSLAVKEKELKSLQQLMDLYENDPYYQLYIWKEAEKVIGIIGAEKRNDEFIIHHVSVIPSYPKKEIAEKMAVKLQQISEFEKLRISNETEPLVSGSHGSIKQNLPSEQIIS